MVMYRGYHIEHRPKPVGTRAFDWEFSHESYDGAPDSGDRRCGTASSLEACKDAIDELEYVPATLEGLRSEWEKGLVTVALEERDGEAFVVANDARGFTCLRYFRLGDGWTVSVDRRDVPAEEAMRWALRQ